MHARSDRPKRKSHSRPGHRLRLLNLCFPDRALGDLGSSPSARSSASACSLPPPLAPQCTSCQTAAPFQGMTRANRRIQKMGTAGCTRCRGALGSAHQLQTGCGPQAARLSRFLCTLFFLRSFLSLSLPRFSARPPRLLRGELPPRLPPSPPSPATSSTMPRCSGSGGGGIASAADGPGVPAAPVRRGAFRLQRAADGGSLSQGCRGE